MVEFWFLLALAEKGLPPLYILILVHLLSEVEREAQIAVLVFLTSIMSPIIWLWVSEAISKLRREKTFFDKVEEILSEVCSSAMAREARRLLERGKFEEFARFLVAIRLMGGNKVVREVLTRAKEYGERFHSSINEAYRNDPVFVASVILEE